MNRQGPNHHDRPTFDTRASAKIRSFLISALALLACLDVRAHWPDQAPHRIAELGEFRLEGGGVIPNLRMSYVTHGNLNAEKDNAILLMHGFAANHHAFDHMIGPGMPFDTDEYFIICTDELGNTQTTFEHSTSPTNSGLKMNFPSYNLRDKVTAEHLLVTQALEIPRLLAVSGISSGGDDSMQMAVSYPDFISGIIPIVGVASPTTQGFFFGPWLISILGSCEGWSNGNYDVNPWRCAANALSVLVPYFYTRDWWEANVDTPEAYTNWRNKWGAYYLDVQDARDLHYRLMAFGRGWLGDTPGFNGDLNAVLRSIKASTLLIVNPDDAFVPPRNVEAMLRAIPDSRAVWIDSPAGHLICCNADPNATRAMGEAISDFLARLRERGRPR